MEIIVIGLLLALLVCACVITSGGHETFKYLMIWIVGAAVVCVLIVVLAAALGWILGIVGWVILIWAIFGDHRGGGGDDSFPESDGL